MKRPNFISDKDIARWDLELSHDPIIYQHILTSPILKEVCYAGMWLVEELSKLDCPPETITDLQYSAGKASFGKDIWNIHQEYLSAYRNGRVDYDIDPKTLN